MLARNALLLALDPGQVLNAQGLTPDPWQTDLLHSSDRQVLLNCARQSGKSTTVAALALHTALFFDDSLVLILSASLRQSGELFRKVMAAYEAMNRPIAAKGESQARLELANGSRLVCLPAREETIRGFSGPRVLLIDEAARVPDDLYRAVRPMLAVSRAGFSA
jgi:phage terminase large subunit-like protein